jgi:hypothetical protein
MTAQAYLDQSEGISVRVDDPARIDRLFEGFIEIMDKEWKERTQTRRA